MSSDVSDWLDEPAIACDLCDILGRAPMGEVIGPCRDNPDVEVYRDALSGAWFIPDHSHIPDDYYARKGTTRTRMTAVDDARRWEQFRRVLSSGDWLDFGCGAGGLLDIARNHGVHGFGVDPGREGGAVGEGYSVVTMFHVIEHLKDPIRALYDLRQRMKPGALLIVETPNARNWLASNCPAFQRFTLLSEHLITHTADTLRATIELAGFTVEYVKGYQRYGWLNHVRWLRDGKPGNHSENCGANPALSARLAERGETDTLIAVAHA